MGAAPSIITVPSTSISKDVECLKALCPSRFRLHPNDNIHATYDATMAVLTDKNGPLTLVLVAIPVAAANRIAANRITFVVPEAELKNVVNRSEHLRLWIKTHPPTTSNNHNNSNNKGSDYELEPEKPVHMAEVNLPGGAGFALVSPSMLSTNAGPQELGRQLAESMLQSLPKGLSRANSQPRRSLSTPRAAPERRQSFGGVRRQSLGGSTGRSTPTNSQKRVAPLLLPVSRASPRAFQTNTSCSTPSSINPHYSLSPTFQKSTLKKNNNSNTITAATDTISNDPPPSFPTLKFSSLHLNGKYKHDFCANARAPIPIETELFVGHMVFLLRPADAADAVWDEKIFAHTSRRLVLQLQGKFKYEPKGPVYAGLEASHDLHMGRLSKGLAGLLLNWAEANNQHLYHSFGNENEKPKVVMPAHTFFDHIVVTPSGQTPPSLFEPLQERPESIDYRKQQSPQDINATKQAQWTWNIADTYSMAFSTSNIDLPSWSLLDVPQLSDLKLSNFIGTSVLRFVMYENLTPREKGTGHLQQHIRYSYAIQCKFIGDSEVKSNNGTLLDWVTTCATEAERKARMQQETKKESNTKDDTDSLQLKQTESDKFPAEERKAKEVDFDHFLEQEGDNDKKEKKVSNLPDLRPKNSKEAFDNLANLDILCPAWIEMCAPQGKYTTAYAFNVNNRTVFRTPQSFRDIVSVKNYLPNEVTDAMMDRLCSPRVADAERTRRRFGKMLESALTGTNADVLKGMMETYSSQFLRRRENSWPAKEKSSGETGGLVARALSDRHWVEEWAEITKKSITFSYPETKKVHFAIQMDCVLCIRCVEKDEAPRFHNYFFMAVESLGRTTYIMFATEDDRRQCFTSISKFVSSDSKLPIYLNAPRKEFLQKSSMWNCDQRLIMNGRQLLFRTPLPAEQLDPLEVVENALNHAFDEEIEHNDEKLQLFLDSVSKLKNVNANNLKEERRVAFFLNLYHVMIRHSALILQATDSQSSLIKIFSCLAYQCSDDIFSIGELEHCIIRAQMTRLAPSVCSTNPKAPPPINSRLLKATSPLQNIPSETFNFPTPSSNYCFALQKADFRICFALNCGSRSNPDQIPIYAAEMLNNQLDGACKSYLNSKVAINQRNKHHVCILPRVCQWYANDFGETNYAILKTLEPYLGLEERKMLHSADFEKFPIIIKHLPFSFECHKLKLKRDQPQYLPCIRSSFSEEEEILSTHSSISGKLSSQSSTHSSTHSSTVSAPLNVLDAPAADTDMDSLLEFLMNDALEI